jgi:acyl-coenzyme A synthetase/AMP-(fatty) acid ligase
VSLAELETDLAGLPWISDAAIVSLVEERGFLGAVAVLSEEGRAELSRLGKFRLERLMRRALSDKHEPMCLPRRWRFVERLPVDHMGKRAARDIAALLAAETPDARAHA